MSSIISWSDIFVVGIGLDIAGAVLLAQGLLMSDRQVLGLSRTYLNLSPDQVVARVGDRIAGSVGVVSLVLGFAAQLAGYVISLSTRSNVDSSLPRGLTAVLFALAAILFVRLAYLVIRHSFERHLLIRVARYDNDFVLQRHPYGGLLLVLGRAANMSSRLDGESEIQYARRVWRVQEVIEGWPANS